MSSTRDAEAAQRFFCNVLHTIAGCGSQGGPVEERVTQSVPSTPRVINVDKNAAYSKAIADLKAAGILAEAVELRHVKYLTNLIEQDHRFIKRLTKPGMGFFSFKTAWRTLQGYEIMNMMRKGQARSVDKEDVRGQAPLIARLFGVTRYAEQSESLPPHFLFLQFLATQPPILHK